MDNLCNNCIHKDVCSRWTATWGMKTCENFREMPKKGHWIEHHNERTGMWHYDCPFCDDGYAMSARDENQANFCHNCGADMRGRSDG